jgi:hypothetical protein
MYISNGLPARAEPRNAGFSSPVKRKKAKSEARRRTCKHDVERKLGMPMGARGAKENYTIRG